MATEITTETTAVDTTPVTPAEHPAIDRLRAELGAIEMDVLTSYTLADAMREGAGATEQKVGGWIEGENACALGAGYLAARARDLIDRA